MAVGTTGEKRAVLYWYVVGTVDILYISVNQKRSRLMCWRGRGRRKEKRSSDFITNSQALTPEQKLVELVPAYGDTVDSWFKILGFSTVLYKR